MLRQGILIKRQECIDLFADVGREERLSDEGDDLVPLVTPGVGGRRERRHGQRGGEQPSFKHGPV